MGVPPAADALGDASPTEGNLPDPGLPVNELGSFFIRPMIRFSFPRLPGHDRADGQGRARPTRDSTVRARG
jgi:hypothetical protein